MILQKEIRQIAERVGVPPTTIDKDWVLGHVLFAMYSNRVLAPNLIFKGGTCLRKCYFGNYRFSEDLDFTINDISIIKRELIEDLVNETSKNSGIIFHIEDISDMLFEDKQVGIKIILKFWGADHPKNQNIPDPQRWHSYIKLEIMCHELMCFETINKTLIHNYSDALGIAIDIPCYAIEEVITEKLRAMLQRKYTAPRDYYDLWYILTRHKPNLNWENIMNAFKSKIAYKSIICNNIDMFFTDKSLKTLRSHWKASLGHHLAETDLPKVEQVINDLKDYLNLNMKFN
jgi:predicted nucleotidyltransferase component of viral defense system